MRFEARDLVEIVTRDITHHGKKGLRMGSRGYVMAYYGRDVIEDGCELRGEVWLVNFSGRKTLCCARGIRRVPPDPAMEPASWADCIWQPAALRSR
jgi:hypothetical protein